MLLLSLFDNPYKDIDLQVPHLLIKYGLVDKFELRFISDLQKSKNIVANGTFKRPAWPFFQFGFKFNFLQQKKILPKTSLMAHLVSNSKLSFKNPDTALGFNTALLFENIVSEEFFLRYQAGLQWDYFYIKNPKLNFSFTPTVAIDENWRVYVELYGTARKTFKPVFNIGGGITYLINDNLKADVSAGYNLNKDKPYKLDTDMYYGFGISYRLRVKQ